MAIGATWSYSTVNVDKEGGADEGTKVVTVEANEAVPERTGITAWRIHTVVPGDQDQLTWQAESDTAIVRYRDDVYAAGGTTDLKSYSTYAPSKLRIDITAAHTVDGATYPESFTETDADAGGSPSSKSKSYTWKVVSAAESITVPAGTFTTIHIQKLKDSGAIDKDYWFARGVGKVQEEDSSKRTEQLTSYSIP